MRTALTAAIVLALGAGGTTHRKREGDGATPVGRLAVLGCFYRADRGLRPPTRIPVAPIRPGDGWCDDPSDPRYNQPNLFQGPRNVRFGFKFQF